MRERGKSYRQKKAPKVHSLKDFRRTPTKALLKRLRIEQFEGPTPYIEGFPPPREIRIPLRQHIGKPALPVIKTGVQVQVGELLAEAPQGELGARIHASLSGRVTEVTDTHIRIAAGSAAKQQG
jgi:Na+-translocating ferredoxin:NAD+ oxidoreductase RnfC subunit